MSVAIVYTYIFHLFETFFQSWLGNSFPGDKVFFLKSRSEVPIIFSSVGASAWD